MASGQSTSREAAASVRSSVVLALLAQLAQVDELVRHVAGDQLVAALAVEQHGHLLARGAHHAPLRVGAGADDGLFLVPDEVAQLVDELRATCGLV